MNTIAFKNTVSFQNKRTESKDGQYYIYRNVILATNRINENRLLFVIRGIDATKYKENNSPMYLFHNDYAFPSGSVYNIRKRYNQEVDGETGIDILVGDINILKQAEEAEQLIQMIDAGYMRGVSITVSTIYPNREYVIGENSPDGEDYIHILKANILEISIVQNPAEERAKIENKKEQTEQDMVFSAIALSNKRNDNISIEDIRKKDKEFKDKMQITKNKKGDKSIKTKPAKVSQKRSGTSKNDKKEKSIVVENVSKKSFYTVSYTHLTLPTNREV